MTAGCFTDGAQKPLILVIDDDEANLQLLERLLRKADMEALTARDGKTGIALAHQRLPNLILLDIFMPGDNGFDLLRHIRADANLKQVPVVIFSVLESPESRKKAFDLGARDYIGKPFDMKEIIIHISKVLGLKC